MEVIAASLGIPQRQDWHSRHGWTWGAPDSLPSLEVITPRDHDKQINQLNCKRAIRSTA